MHKATAMLPDLGMHGEVVIPGASGDHASCQVWQGAKCATQVRKLAPKHLQTLSGPASHAHVTCANFSRQGEIVATYNDEASEVFCRRHQLSPISSARRLAQA